jgi:hypothetical protein
VSPQHFERIWPEPLLLRIARLGYGWFDLKHILAAARLPPLKDARPARRSAAITLAMRISCSQIGSAAEG